MIRAGRGFARIVGSVERVVVRGQGYVLVVSEPHFCDQPGIPPIVFHSFGVSVYVVLGSECQPVPQACEMELKDFSVVWESLTLSSERGWSQPEEARQDE